jgi:multisubunit Na+/H+ antiporter MnhC subunit
MTTTYPFLLGIVFFALGLYGILVKKDLFKMIFGISLIGYSTNIFLVTLGFVEGGSVPIETASRPIVLAVDPLMQALILTAIVIEFAIEMLMVSMVIRIFQTEKKTDGNLVATTANE